MDRAPGDPHGMDALALRPRLEERTSEVLDQVTGRLLDTRSTLPGWTRRTIMSHLAAVAVELDRLTDAALRGRPATMYQGRPENRRATLQWGEGRPTVEVIDRFSTTANRLHATWRALDETTVDRVVVDDRLGPMSIGRLIVLRFTEIEVHGSDLLIGRSPERWLPQWVEIALPLRIESLPQLRARFPESHAIDGGFLLVASDLDRSWYVTADGADAYVDEGDEMAATVAPDDAIVGTSNRLVQLLLGRTAPETFSRSWHKAKAFKEAFPGP